MRLEANSAANQLAIEFDPDDRRCPVCRCWARPDCLSACPEPYRLAREYQAWRTERGIVPSSGFLNSVVRFEAACAASRFPCVSEEGGED